MFGEIISFNHVSKMSRYYIILISFYVAVNQSKSRHSEWRKIRSYGYKSPWFYLNDGIQC